MNSAVYVYSLPDLTLAGAVDVGVAPDWVTLTPDGRTAYVANAGSNSVSVVDIVGMREVMRIPVGQVPKRNITGDAAVTARIIFRVARIRTKTAPCQWSSTASGIPRTCSCRAVAFE